MATTTRFLRSSKPLRHVNPPNTTSPSITSVKCAGNKAGLCAEKVVSKDGDKKTSTVVVKASSVATSERSLISTLEPHVGQGIDLGSLLAAVKHGLLNKLFRPDVKRKPWNLQVQMFLERVVIDCRFFTIFAVAGSLLGSVLCFVEGCILILETYFQYLSTLSQSSHQEHMVRHLIEAIDMFLVGTAMLIFGIGLYVMFVGSKNFKAKGPRLPGSNLFGLYHLKSLPTWLEMESVTKAKSRIGHAVMMILQVGLLEKFKSVPLVTSLDLACFAGAVLISSACIFILSRLSVGGLMEGR